jgi:probable phosphoglycerate mutase
MVKRSSRIIRIVGLCLLLLIPAASRQALAQSGSVLRIYLARHGQTDWNLEGRTQGGIDTHLNNTGRQQALQLKTWLKDIRFASVYSSTLSRTQETAEIVRGSVPLTKLPGLGERRFGKFEGLLTSDPQAGPEFERRRWDLDDSLDGGESLKIFADRVRTTIDGIRKKHRSGAILIVGHANTNQMIIKILLNLTVDQMRTFTQDNNELYLIELESGKTPRLWKLITEANLKDL